MKLKTLNMTIIDAADFDQWKNNAMFIITKEYKIQNEKVSLKGYINFSSRCNFQVNFEKCHRS